MSSDIRIVIGIVSFFVFLCLLGLGVGKREFIMICWRSVL